TSSQDSATADKSEAVADNRAAAKDDSAAPAAAGEPTILAAVDEDAKQDQPSDAAPAATDEAPAEKEEPEADPKKDEIAEFVQSFSNELNEKIGEASQGKEV